MTLLIDYSQINDQSEVLSDYRKNFLFAVSIITTLGKIGMLFWSWIINLVGSLGCPIPSYASRHAMHILAGTWFLVMVVMDNSSSSTLISYLMALRMKSTVNSFQDLANNPDTKLTIEKSFVLTDTIMVCITIGLGWSVTFAIMIASAGYRHISVLKIVSAMSSSSHMHCFAPFANSLKRKPMPQKLWSKVGQNLAHTLSQP